MAAAESFPLHWPATWPRTPLAMRKPAKFSGSSYGNGYRRARALTVAEAVARLQRELDLLGVGSTILSCNVERRLDGLPRSCTAEPSDPGVAVYFRLDGRDTVLACDRWSRVADNVAAIAAHIGALRGIERWGVGSLAQAFAGYAALPAPAAKPWRVVLAWPDDLPVTREEIEKARRTWAKLLHPDGGSSPDEARMAVVNAACDSALRELEARP